MKVWEITEEPHPTLSHLLWRYQLPYSAVGFTKTREEAEQMVAMAQLNLQGEDYGDPQAG